MVASVTMCLEIKTPSVVKLRSEQMKEENQVDPSTPTAVIHKSELSHPSTPLCLRQRKCRSIGAEEETGGTQNKIVSVNGSIITGKINTLNLILLRLLPKVL